jgi:branched-chain amino acid transport system ATP-binding protein
MTAILETKGLAKRFGGVHVARDIDFTIEQGEMHCLIGPNGAGKSSFFRLILGEVQPDAGTIVFKGKDLGGLRPFARIKEGISVKFQVPGIFKALSIRQNLEIAFQSHLHHHALEETIARVLAFVELTDVSHETAGSLSHGQQQWLEIGMAIGVEPSLLLLDEPTAGMSPDETHKTGEMLRQLNQQGITILAVEHDMAFVQQIADRVTVLHFGAIFAQGSVAEITANQDVAEIYLGHGYGD